MSWLWLFWVVDILGFRLTAFAGGANDDDGDYRMEFDDCSGDDLNIKWLTKFFLNSDTERRSQFQVMTLHQSSLLYRFWNIYN